jgi:hypothetical protein
MLFSPFCYFLCFIYRLFFSILFSDTLQSTLFSHDEEASDTLTQHKKYNYNSAYFSLRGFTYQTETQDFPNGSITSNHRIQFALSFFQNVILIYYFRSQNSENPPRPDVKMVIQQT